MFGGGVFMMETYVIRLSTVVTQQDITKGSHICISCLDIRPKVWQMIMRISSYPKKYRTLRMAVWVDRRCPAGHIWPEGSVSEARLRILMSHKYRERTCIILCI
jgi:hypothetical protein